MHSAARKCIVWAAALIAFGTALTVFVPNWIAALALSAGSEQNAVAIYDSVTFILRLVQDVTIPVGAALIGAAIVINAILPSRTGDKPE